MPAAIRCDQHVGLFRPPTAGLVGEGRVVVLKDWFDHRPGGLDGDFAGEKRAITGHGVVQEPFVGRFRSSLFFEQVKFSLVAHELLPCAFDASGEGNGGTG